jgi:hypothetical protein
MRTVKKVKPEKGLSKNVDKYAQILPQHIPTCEQHGSIVLQTESQHFPIVSQGVTKQVLQRIAAILSIRLTWLSDSVVGRPCVLDGGSGDGLEFSIFLKTVGALVLDETVWNFWSIFFLKTNNCTLDFFKRGRAAGAVGERAGDRLSRYE